VQRCRHRRLASPLEPLDRQQRDGCSREIPTTELDTGPMAIVTVPATPIATATAIVTVLPTPIATATVIPMVMALALGLATATLAEVLGTRPIRPYMGIAHIGRVVAIGALIAARTRDVASFANLSLQSFE